MILPASYQSGFAPRDGEPLYPDLWRGCIGNWEPSLGPSGLVLRDHSDRGNHATMTNGAKFSAIAGQYAADLDGTNDHVLINLSQLMIDAFNSNKFTVSLWVFVRSFSNSPVLWSCQASVSTDSGVIETNNTGTILYVKTANNTSGLTGARTYTLSTAMTTKRWTHIIVTKTNTGDNGDLYVNGVRQTSYTGTMNTCGVTSSYVMYYGIYQSAVPLNGAVDGMRIYDHAISDNRVQLLASRRGIAHELAPVRYAGESLAAYTRRLQHAQLIGGGLIG